jgi:hypothetical protein
MQRWAIGVMATAVVLASGSAHATMQGTYALQRWKVMDNCAKQAQKAFPDFSAASNAKRNAAEKNCLNASNLPPREPSSPPSH